jgi:CMP-N-acetylneuraminic acid synthetase
LNILTLIPARSGSKGIPKKNIKLFCNKPLIAWTIETALMSGVSNKIVVSTDDSEIAKVSLEYGAEVPFMRPSELALDSTPGVDPALHAISMLNDYDWLLLLQPTSPLRNIDDIIGITEYAKRSKSPSIVSVSESSVHPYNAYTMEQNYLRSFHNEFVACRQQLPKSYSPNGALYFIECDWLLEQKSFITDSTVGYCMPKSRSIDIDDELDWVLAEFLMQKSFS